MIKAIKAQLNFWRLNTLSLLRKKQLHYSTDKTMVAHLRKKIDCNHKWYGSSYGGFYINPSLLNENSIIYSFGIGKDITFDLACIRNHKCKVFGFDPTPKSINYISSKRINEKFKFFQYGIASETAIQEFFLPADSRGVSGSLVNTDAVDEKNKITVQMKSFTDITSELGHTAIDVVKMDIEGSEYEVLENVIDAGIPVKQILVEFHDRLFDPTEFRSKHIVEKMRLRGYEIFAVSMSFEEVSFIYRN